jgi:MFS family permease
MPAIAAPSLWRPLRVPIFRYLLIADIVSDTGAFLQSVAAAWLMVSFGVGPMYVALTQTASSLPFFLLALPAGALGDIVDRRKLILFTESWMLGVAIALAAATIAGLMTPWLLLLLTFALSAGDAIEAPTWRAIFPDLIDREDLAPAMALSGIEFNLARAIGPGLGGFLVAAAGAGTAFALNAVSFLGAIIVIARWRHTSQRRTAPVERLGSATAAAMRYVRYSPAIRTLLLRAGCVTFFASALLALLPSVAAASNRGAAGYGVLLGLFGAGAVVGALLMQPACVRMSTEALVSAGTLVIGVAIILTGTTHNLIGLCAVMLVGGAAWILFISILTSQTQLLTPDWVRARVLAVFMLVFQGSMAAGSAVWGVMAQRSGIRLALITAGVGTLAASLLALYARLSDAVGDPTIWNHWRMPAIAPALEPDADEGPVLVTMEYLVQPGRSREFVDAIHDFERVRRRDGATQWGVFYDSETPDRYLETFMVPSWAEHLRQHARLTVADRDLEERVNRTLRAKARVSHFIYAEREDPTT